MLIWDRFISLQFSCLPIRHVAQARCLINFCSIRRKTMDGYSSCSSQKTVLGCRESSLEVPSSFSVKADSLHDNIKMYFI